MSDVVVYSARPDRVLGAASLLQSHGVACRIVQGPPIGFPWVTLSLPHHQVVVPEHVAPQARALLRSLESAEAASAGSMARAARWPLLAIALAAVSALALVVAAPAGSPAFTLGSFASLAFWVILVLSFRRLRKAAPAVGGKEVS